MPRLARPDCCSSQGLCLTHRLSLVPFCIGSAHIRKFLHCHVLRREQWVRSTRLPGRWLRRCYRSRAVYLGLLVVTVCRNLSGCSEQSDKAYSKLLQGALRVRKRAEAMLKGAAAASAGGWGRDRGGGQGAAADAGRAAAMSDPTMEAAVSNLDLGSSDPGAASGGHEEGATMRIGRRCYIGAPCSPPVLLVHLPTATMLVGAISRPGAGQPARVFALWTHKIYWISRLPVQHLISSYEMGPPGVLACQWPRSLCRKPGVEDQLAGLEG